VSYGKKPVSLLAREGTRHRSCSKRAALNRTGEVRDKGDGALYVRLHEHAIKKRKTVTHLTKEPLLCSALVKRKAPALLPRGDWGAALNIANVPQGRGRDDRSGVTLPNVFQACIAGGIQTWGCQDFLLVARGSTQRFGSR